MSQPPAEKPTPSSLPSEAGDLSSAATSSAQDTAAPADVAPERSRATLPPTVPDELLGLVRLLHESGQLSREHLDEIARLRAEVGEPRPLASMLVQRGWATPFQVNQVFRGRASKLALGPYLLVERLGEGGMGQVFKAYHRVMHRHVALKIIRPEHCANADVRDRFLVEIRALARLSHPNIVQVYDANEAEGTLYFAMEYVPGVDLARLVQKGHPLPVGRVCEWVRQAALGLQHAHENGLVHRDVKPSNLLLADSAGGAVKLLDLGLVRARPPGDASAPALTHCGAIMGTPDYIAPEQILDAHGVDVRGDVYSLGCTLYHLLAGRVPFPGGSVADKLRAHQSAEPPALARGDVPPTLAAVCRRMMAKDPAQRFQTPREVAEALAPFCQADAPGAAQPPTGPYAAPAGSDTQHTAAPSAAAGGAGKKKIWLVTALAGVGAAAALLVCTGIAALVALGGRATRGPDYARPNLVADGGPADPRDSAPPADKGGGDKPGPPRDKRPPGDKPPADKPPPDAPVRKGDPKALDYHLKTLGDDRGRHWAPVHAVAYSPDGRWLVTAVQAARGRDSLHLLDAATLREQAALDTDYVPSMAFAPDSKTLAVVGGAGGVQLWEVHDGGLVKGPAVVAADGEKNRPFGELQFTTDGRRLLCRNTQGVVWRWKLDEGRWRQDLVTKPPRDGFGVVAVAADGRTLAYTAQAPGAGKTQVWLKDLDRPDDEPRLVTQSLAGVSTLAVSDDGRLVAFDAGREVAVWEVSGQQPRKWPAVKPPTTEPAAWRFSPDGRSLLCGTLQPGRRVDRPLWVCEVREQGAAAPVELKDACPMIGGVSPSGAASFGGDGNRLAVGGLDHTVRVYERDGKAWRLPPEFAGHAGPVREVSFSPGGIRLVALSRATVAPEHPEPSSLRVWEVEKGGAPAVTLTPPGWFQQARFVGEKELLACGIEFPGQGPNLALRQGFVGRWDAVTGQELPRQSFTGQSCSLSVSGDGKRVAVGGSAPGRAACASSRCRTWRHSATRSRSIRTSAWRCLRTARRWRWSAGSSATGSTWFRSCGSGTSATSTRPGRAR
jgi:serine/threonine-protein kinase